MSIDVSLRMKSSLVRHRNVLTRAERVERMKADGRLDDKKGVLGLAKVGNRKPKTAAKTKKKEEGADAGATAAAPAK
jgi:small basic protein (TIGR04137 family)